MVIRVEAPQDKGFAILSPLLFNSEAWLTALTRDSTRLISTASQAIVTASAAAAEEEEEDGKKKAPFELFEEVWYELGWHRVHLFGVCSGPSRVAWGASLARSFLSASACLLSVLPQLTQKRTQAGSDLALSAHSRSAPSLRCTASSARRRRLSSPCTPTSTPVR